MEMNNYALHLNLLPLALINQTTYGVCGWHLELHPSNADYLVTQRIK